MGTVFADGVEVGHSEKWQETTQTTLPPDTSLVALELVNENPPGRAGLLASLDNTWSTGDPGLKCTDNSFVNDNNWKFYSMYHFFVSLSM